MSYGSPNQPDFSSSTPTPPPQKSNTLWWVLGILAFLGVGGAIACCGGLGLIAYVGTQAVNGVVQQAIASDPAIQEHIGTISGLNMNLAATGEAGGNGNTLVFDIVGDKGSGKLEVVMDKGNSQSISSAVLVLPNGERYDVALTPPQAEPTLEVDMEPSATESLESDPASEPSLTPESDPPAESTGTEPNDINAPAAEPALQ